MRITFQNRSDLVHRSLEVSLRISADDGADDPDLTRGATRAPR